ncbi:Ig-like domain-containing protein [Tunicatimonas pelagia]|uniref:Ig-like domain-containing protein n=1 Tax=Tunicatimonas pelagia TaxID=931531 RepID=UPI0026665043|nr:Ig-like domain-containing protein [Tunicatimonas pelagia]WKN45159.1 Ig-like domain-containing protein [Tunicatimonas pelagia]
MVKTRHIFSWLLLAALLVRCIGTDVVDDANDIFPVIIQPPAQNSLLVGETLTLAAERQTTGGETIPTESFTWISSNPDVASVGPQGAVEAIAAGQTRITATVGNSTSEPWLLTVVANQEEVAQISVTAERTSLEVGETLQLAAMARNVSGELMSDQMFRWQSTDESVVTVDDAGLLTAVGNGSAEIVARIDEVESTPFSVIVGATARMGTFQGVGSYDAKGMGTLSLNEDGELILTTSEDFETEFAAGTFLYLANSTAGDTVAVQGVEIADISDNLSGAQTFNISDINENIELDTYRYIIILCKPFRITFGLADLDA